jgi:hypothetical protein
MGLAAFHRQGEPSGSCNSHAEPVAAPDSPRDKGFAGTEMLKETFSIIFIYYSPAAFLTAPVTVIVRPGWNASDCLCSPAE